MLGRYRKGKTTASILRTQVEQNIWRTLADGRANRTVVTANLSSSTEAATSLNSNSRTSPQSSPTSKIMASLASGETLPAAAHSGLKER